MSRMFSKYLLMCCELSTLLAGSLCWVFFNKCFVHVFVDLLAGTATMQLVWNVYYRFV